MGVHILNPVGVGQGAEIPVALKAPTQRYGAVFSNVFILVYFAMIIFEFVNSFIMANS